MVQSGQLERLYTQLHKQLYHNDQLLFESSRKQTYRATGSSTTQKSRTYTQVFTVIRAACNTLAQRSSSSELMVDPRVIAPLLPNAKRSRRSLLRQITVSGRQHWSWLKHSCFKLEMWFLNGRGTPRIRGGFLHRMLARVDVCADVKTWTMVWLLASSSVCSQVIQHAQHHGAWRYMHGSSAAATRRNSIILQWSHTYNVYHYAIRESILHYTVFFCNMTTCATRIQGLYCFGLSGAFVHSVVPVCGCIRAG